MSLAIRAATLRTLAIALADHSTARLPVELHEGPAGRVLVAGTSRWSRALPDRFFGESPRRIRRIAVAPVWRLPGILERWRPRVDLLVARVDRLSSRWFAEESWTRVPEWIRTVAPVLPEGVRLASGQARRKQQLVANHGLRWRLSHDPAELQTFIDRDYRPYLLERHGPQAHLRSSRWFQQHLRRGGLIWIEHGQVPVAGVLYDQRGSALRHLAAACVQGDPALLRLGALAATYLACFEQARALGCRHLDLRNSRPWLGDGLLKDKLGWGGVLQEADDLTHDLLLSWRSATPVLLRFLTASPLICRQADGFAVLRAGPARQGSGLVAGAVQQQLIHDGDPAPGLASAGSP